MAEPTDAPCGKPAKKGHGAGSREKRLHALPHWDEIEVRLQHRWTPDRVLEWYGTTYRGEAGPSRAALYRFLKGKAESWYVPELVFAQPETSRVSRILVLRQQANMIETQTLRLNRALTFEGKTEGAMYPEVRANLDLLNRLLESHLKAQQAAGIEPKVSRGAQPDREQPPPPPQWDLSSLSLEQIIEFRRLLAIVLRPPAVIDGEATRLDAPPCPVANTRDSGA